MTQQGGSSCLTKKLLPRAAGVLVFSLLLTTAPAIAGLAESGSTAQLTARISQLENQIQTLSRAVFRGDAPKSSNNAQAFSSSDSSSGAAAYAGLEQRISQIEEQQRDLTGRVERLSYDLQQMQSSFERMQKDNDMRFQQMQGSSAVAPAIPLTGNTSSSSMPQLTGDLYATGNNLGTLSSSGSTSGPEGLYESAFADIRDSRYAEAETKLKKFMSVYPAHGLAGNAQYWLAETYYVRGNYREAAKMFAQGYQDYPQSAKAADSLLKLGLSLAKLGKKDDACLSLQQLKKQFPGDATPTSRRADQEMSQLGCK